MQQRQCVEGGRQHFPYFIGTQCAPAKDLIERLLGIFHHDKDKFALPGPAPAHLEKTDQVRMGERRRSLPVLKLSLRPRSVGPYEFDSGVGKVFRLVFGKEYRAML